MAWPGRSDGDEVDVVLPGPFDDEALDEFRADLVVRLR